MSRLAACPKCRNQFTLPVLTGPATIACPFCGAHITIKMRQAAPPPAMVVQPAMAVTQAMPVDEEDFEEEEERPRKKKGNKNKKSKKKGSLNESSESDENWLKASILIGIFVITIVSIVLVFVMPFWQYKSKPNIIKSTGPIDRIDQLK